MSSTSYHDAASSSSSSAIAAGDDIPGRIRKRRFSTARIQPTRIKKIMQSDEEIGRMIASVPVAVGSVMEHFAEKLLEASASIMHQTMSKTLSTSHVFTAIQQTPYFRFLSPLAAGGMPCLSGPATTTSAPTFPVQFRQPLAATGTSNGAVLHHAPSPVIKVSSPMKPVVPSLPVVHAPSTAAGASNGTMVPVKRKRGRPRKDQQQPKEKYVPVTEETKPFPLTAHQFPSTSGNDNSWTNNNVIGIGTTGTNNSSNDLDRQLMPPPLRLPNRRSSSSSSGSNGNSPSPLKGGITPPIGENVLLSAAAAVGTAVGSNGAGGPPSSTTNQPDAVISV